MTPPDARVEQALKRKLEFFRDSANIAINSLIKVLDEKNRHDLNYRIKCVEETAELLMIYRTYIDCLNNLLINQIRNWEDLK